MSCSIQSAAYNIQKVTGIKPQRETQNTISGSGMGEDDTEDRIAPVVDHIEWLQDAEEIIQIGITIWPSQPQCL